jgi:hypothetical protein
MKSIQTKCLQKRETKHIVTEHDFTIFQLNMQIRKVLQILPRYAGKEYIGKLPSQGKLHSIFGLHV